MSKYADYLKKSYLEPRQQFYQQQAEIKNSMSADEYNQLYGAQQNNDDDNLAEAAYHGLAGMTGYAIHTINDAMSHMGWEASDKKKTLEEWNESRPELAKNISKWGRELEAAHQRNYTPWGANQIVSGVAGFAPFLVGLGVMGASMARTDPYKALALAADTVANKLKVGPKAAQALSTVAPALVYGPATKIPEAMVEWQGAYDDYIDEAKKTGNYIPGVTEAKAETDAYNVGKDNVALLTGTGILEQILSATNPGLGGGLKLAKNLLASSGTNAVEEGAQEIFPNYEAGKAINWNDVANSAVIGAISGGAMTGGSSALNYMADKRGGQNAPEHSANIDTYNNIDWSAIPTQGEAITTQLQHLDPKWYPHLSPILNQLNNMGVDGVYSSGARTAEHNAEVGGAENSHHKEDGRGYGDAVDIVLGDISQEQADSIADYFKNTGMFKEVLFHDVGSGYHLHLGGLNAEGSGTAVNNSGYDNNFTDKQNEAWGAANWASNELAKDGYNIPAEWIYSQWAHESGNFESTLARENNNIGGLTQSTPNGEENKQPDGDNYYRVYDSLQDYAKSYVNDFIKRYDGMKGLNSMEEFVYALKNNGYFGDDPAKYLADMQGVKIPNGTGTMRNAGNSNPANNTNIPDIRVDNSSTNAVFQQMEAQLNAMANGKKVDFKNGPFSRKNFNTGLQQVASDIRDSLEGEELNEFNAMFDFSKKNPRFIVNPKNVQKLMQSHGDKVRRHFIEKFNNKYGQQNDTPKNNQPVVQEQNDIPQNANLPQQEPVKPLPQPQEAPKQEQQEPVTPQTERNDVPQLNAPVLQAPNQNIPPQVKDNRPAPQNTQSQQEDNRNQALRRSPMIGATSTVDMSYWGNDVSKANADVGRFGGRHNQSVSTNDGIFGEFAFPDEASKKAWEADISGGLETAEQNTPQKNESTPVTPAPEKAENKNEKEANKKRASWRSKKTKAQKKIAGFVKKYENGELSADEAKSKIDSEFNHFVTAIKTYNDEQEKNNLINGLRMDAENAKAEISELEEKQVNATGKENPTAMPSPASIIESMPKPASDTNARNAEIQQGFESAINSEAVEQLAGLAAKKQAEATQNQREVKGNDWHGFMEDKPDKIRNAARNSLLKPARWGGTLKDEMEVWAEANKKFIAEGEEPCRAVKNGNKYYFVDHRSKTPINKAQYEYFNHLMGIDEAANALANMKSDSDTSKNQQESKESSEDSVVDKHVETAYRNISRHFNTVQLSDNPIGSPAYDAKYGARNIEEAISKINNLHKEAKTVLAKEIKEIPNITEKQKNEILERVLTRINQKVEERTAELRVLDESNKQAEQEQSDKEAKEAEDKKKKETMSDLHGFGADKPAMTRGAIRKTLSKKLRYTQYARENSLKDGIAPADKEHPLTGIMTRAEFIEKAESMKDSFVRADKDKNGKSIYKLLFPHKGFKDWRNSYNEITKAEYEYFQHLRTIRNDGAEGLLPLSNYTLEQPTQNKENKKETLVYSAQATDNSDGIPTVQRSFVGSNVSQNQQKVKENQQEEKKESIFGEYNEDELFDALGIEAVDETNEQIKIVDLVDDSEEAEAKLIAELKKKLNTINSGFDPTIMVPAFKLGAIYIQRGINKFPEWKSKLTEAVGEEIAPWAKPVWESLKTYPQDRAFNETHATKIFQSVGALYEHGEKDIENIKKRITRKMSKDNAKRFAPIIESAYNGVKTYFDEMEAENNGRQQTESGSTAGGPESVQSEDDKKTEKGEDKRTGLSGAVPERSEGEGARDTGSDEKQNTSRTRPDSVREGTELGETDSKRDSTGRNKPASQELTEAQKNPSPTEIPGHNYEIKESATGKTGEATRFKQNIAAIKMLKQLESENRMPTPTEQEILAAYNGWGSLKNAFLDDTKENIELKELLTDEEYRAAEATINDAFYTSPDIVRAIWKGVSRLGFKGGRVLDPSMGVGNFYGCMPRGMMKKSSLQGVEIDNLTSRFAKMLYPSAYVENTGFQKAELANDFFDLVISNIPFGQLKIDGYKIHNYFFANGIDKVRPGGLMVFVTSQGSLTNSEDGARMRNYLDGKADMIAAYKLPEGAFAEAGTGVITDIVIFQKRGKDGAKSTYAQEFTELTTMTDGVTVNDYFEKHPENVLGNVSVVRDQYYRPALSVKQRDGESIADSLNKAMEKLPENIYAPQNRSKSKAFNTTEANKKARADEKTRDLEYYIKDGKVVQNQGGEAVAITGKKADVVKAYVGIKNDLNALIIAQCDPKATDKQLSALRAQLNKSYDSFVKKFGYLTDTAVEKNYRDDPSAGMVMALERPIFAPTEYSINKNGQKVRKPRKVISIEKANIFTERTMQAISEVKTASTPSDALLASLAQKGDVDLEYMAGLLKSTPEKVAASLKGQIFKNPITEEYETRDEYLSGNVREKLAQAKTAAKADKSYQNNVDELTKVIPEDLVSDEIIVNMGAPWIPVSDIQDFVNSIADRGNVTVRFFPLAAKWIVAGWGNSSKFNFNRKMDMVKTLEHILNNKAIEITIKDSDGHTYLDQNATDTANVTADEIRAAFKDWIWSDKAREKRLVRYYNDNYNNTVTREYDGSHLGENFPGMVSTWKMKPHQQNVVWRMLQKSNTLIAHCVGAGKTAEMQAAGMEMRRLGIAKKPLYCLPNNVVEQFTREFRQLYPNAKLLVLTTNDLPAVKSTSKKTKTEDGRIVTTKIDLKTLPAKEREKILKGRADRNRTLARIQTEDWDGIIISHTMFERLPLTPETTNSFIEEQIQILKRTKREAKAAKGELFGKRALSILEDQIESLQNRMERILNTSLDDIGIPFEQLGIDQIFVDEADLFKNLHYATSMDRVSGLANSDANRSNDMFAKTQWLTRTLGGRGVVFATGTPISNTMAEMYTMLRYMDMQGLKEKNLDLFDNWIRTFAEIGSGIERKPSGDGFRKVNKVKNFINMADLIKMFRKVADVKTKDDLDLNIPNLKNDKNTVVTIKADPAITKYIKEVVPKRIDEMKNDPDHSDNMLVLTNDLRKLSLNDSKINACADQIVKKFAETEDVKGAQLVFCDMGIPKAEKENKKEDEESTDNEFEVADVKAYEDLKQALINKGIPENQIAFVHDAKNKAEQAELFQKVDSGELRILIGSTSKMGAGTNCQHHLVALHHLDAPWRPRDIEQREGRILRQGNQNEEVEIFNYVVQDSFDANMWEKLKNKAAIIAQAMSGDSTMRVVEDADLVTLSYAEVEGAATGNPLIKEQLSLNNEVTKYAHAQTSFKKKQRDAERDIETLPAEIEQLKKTAEKIKADIAERTDTKGEAFTMKIGDTIYTERSKAETALKNILKGFTAKASTKIGEIGGFDLKAMKTEAGYSVDGVETESGVRLQLVNHFSYAVDTASVQGIENRLRKAPESSLNYIEQQAEEKESQLKSAHEVVKRENPYAEKLKTLQARLTEVNREIEKTLMEGGQKQEDNISDEDVGGMPKEDTSTISESEQVENVNDDNLFDTSDFTHTKTGEQIVAAKLLPDLKEHWGVITSIAKSYGGSYNRFAKRFFFTKQNSKEANEQKRDTFIEKVKQMLRDKGVDIKNVIQKMVSTTKPKKQSEAEKIAAEQALHVLRNSGIEVITDTAEMERVLGKSLEQSATDDAIQKMIVTYEEGNKVPDLTLTEREINGKTMYGVAFVGQRPKNYVPKKIGKAYKLMELHPDGTIHALFAGTGKAFEIGKWNWAEGFSPDEKGAVKQMNLAPRYGWHMGTGVPASYHLMGVGDVLDPKMVYPTKSGIGHPKGSKRVWCEVHYDATNDYSDIAAQNPGREKDIRGLIPFGGYYMFQEGNLSNWIIASSIKFDHILTDSERQKILDEAGYNEELVWRKQVLTSKLKAQLTVDDKKLSGQKALSKNETMDSVQTHRDRIVALQEENEARIKELNDGKDWKYKKRSEADLAAERERIRKAVFDNPELKAKRESLKETSNGMFAFDFGDDTQYLRTKVGEVYGFVKDGKIYIDESKMDASVPIHEYTHVWDNLVRERNPELWKHGVELMKKTKIWADIMKNPAYANIIHDENLVASEVHARLVGENGRIQFLGIVAKKQTREGLVAWAKEFWQSVRSAFSEWTGAEAKNVSLDEFIQMPLADFFNETNLGELQDKRAIDNDKEKVDNKVNKIIEDFKNKLVSNIQEAFLTRFGRDKGKYTRNELLSNDFRESALRALSDNYNQYLGKISNYKDFASRVTGRNLSDWSVDECKAVVDNYREMAKEMLDYGKYIFGEVSRAYTAGAGNYDEYGSARLLEAAARNERDFTETEHLKKIRAHITAKVNNQKNERSANQQDAFSNDQIQLMAEANTDEAIQRQEQGFFNKLLDKFLRKIGSRYDSRITVAEYQPDKNTMGWFSDWRSPSRLAEKIPTFRPFYEMGSRAVEEVVKQRSRFNRKLDKVLAVGKDEILKSDKDKQNLFNALLAGDSEGHEYTADEFRALGYRDNIYEAYKKIRGIMTSAYIMIDKARRHINIYTKDISKETLDKLQRNKFVTVTSYRKNDNGSYHVTWKGSSKWDPKNMKHWEKEIIVDNDTADSMKTDESVQVVYGEQLPTGEWKLYINEEIPPLNKLEGYIPHFFHEYMVDIKGKNGEWLGKITSARTEREAVKAAEEYLKDHQLEEGQTIVIRPKSFDFDTLSSGMEKNGAAVMGIKEYSRMLNDIAEQNAMTFEEAKKMVDGSVRLNSRHRFFGNLLQRKGVEGYETNLDWVLRHYVNMASRYSAMETYFKPQAVNLFERLYGDISKEYTGLPKYIKNYIYDINGNPSSFETWLNENILKCGPWRKWIASNFGERAALQLGNSIANTVSMMTLGVWNVSSALLNFSQIMNATAYLGDISAVGKILKAGAKRKYDYKDMRVLVETGVLNDIGLDSGSGYDINRSSKVSLKQAFKNAGAFAKKVGQWGMLPFKTTESMVRRGTVLTAYHKARLDGKSHDEAIKFASEVNRKSNFDYGVADAPNIFRRGSIVSQLLLQFKKYGIKELEVMGDVMPMLSDKTSTKQKLMFWGMYFMTCGLLGIPFLNWPDDTLQTFVGWSPKDHMQEAIMTAAGDSKEGKMLANVAMYGLASVGGINISSRAGLSDVIPTRMLDVGGATFGKTVNLGFDLAAGNIPNAVRDVSPGLYNILMATYWGESEGKRGRTMTRYEDTWSRILRGAGFRSVKESNVADVERIMKRNNKKKQQEEQEAIDAYIENPSGKNGMRLKELGISPKRVQAEREKKKMDRTERLTDGMSKQKLKEAQGGVLQFLGN